MMNEQAASRNHVPECDIATTLRETNGVCTTCLKPVPAKVLVYEDRVELQKECPEHGVNTQLLSRCPSYWAETDRFYFKVNDKVQPQRDYIVRMTETCNLDCPICLARANQLDNPDLDLSYLEDLLSKRRGIKIDLMAAEPTLRKDLETWVRKVKASGNIAALHTNGLKLANREYAEKMKAAGVDEVFLQFDGFNEEANKRLRGRPLVKARMAAIKNLRELGIATSLIVVVGRGLNEEQVGEVFRFALKPENGFIREVFYMGLRLLGSANDSSLAGDHTIDEMALMPDDLIELLTEQVPRINREDILAFNKVYFSMLSAAQVKKCLYVQHYMAVRDRGDDWRPISDVLDLRRLERAADKYAERFQEHPTIARAGLVASLGRAGFTPKALALTPELLRLQQIFKAGMNLTEVPRRFLLLGFITACDPLNFDAKVAENCGKGELSSDGGFIESGAVANVARERRVLMES